MRDSHILKHNMYKRERDRDRERLMYIERSLEPHVEFVVEFDVELISFY